jgi:hypothetical protein
MKQVEILKGVRFPEPSETVCKPPVRPVLFSVFKRPGYEDPGVTFSKLAMFSY